MANTDRIKGISSGLAVKAPVRAATTAAITLAGLQTIDGIVLASGDRVLVKDQADSIDNGWYDVSTSAWSRSVDANGNNDLVTGTMCVVAAGATNGLNLFRLDSTGTITPGTTALTFSASVSFAAVSAFIATLFDDADAATARTTLGAASTGANTFTGSQTLGATYGLVFEGTTDDAFETTLTVTDPTADRTVTLPNGTTTLAGLSVAETFTAPQRGTITTDNDGSFDQAASNNFACTPTGAVALTFTNHTAGQSGLVLFVNGSNYAITAAATTYIAAADLTKLSATGTYLIAYLDNGTNAYCTVTAALTSAGA